MKKVIIFHQALAPYRIDLWNTLDKYFDVSLFFMQKNLVNQKFDQDKLRKSLNLDVKYHTKGFDFKTKIIRWGFRRYLKKEKPNVVFTYEFSLTTLILYYIRKFFNYSFEIVITCDDNLEMATSFTGYRKFLRYVLVSKIDYILFTNEIVANWYKENFNLKNDSTALVLPIIHEKNRFQKLLVDAIPISNNLIQKYKLDGKKIFFYVGRLSKEKNLSVLINAFKLINTQNSESRLLIIGDGLEKNKLVKLSENLSVQDHVIFLGRLEDLNLMACYNIGQIFILPSKFEPYGAVVGEALQAGARVICSDRVGSKYLIRQSVNGSVFFYDNFVELADLMYKESTNFNTVNLIKKVRKSNLFDDFEARIRVVINTINKSN